MNGKSMIFQIKNKYFFTLWVQKPENVVSPSADYESSTSGSPASSSKSSQRRVMFSDIKDAQRKSISRKVDNASPTDSFPERTQAGDLFSAAVGVRHLPPVEGWGQRFLCFILKGTNKDVGWRGGFIYQFSEKIDGTSSKNPGDSKLQVRSALSVLDMKAFDMVAEENIQILKDGIREKKLQMRVLEQRMLGSVEISPYGSSVVEMSQALSRLATQLNEKTFELEIKSADNRVLQEQLRTKTLENTEMQETTTLLRQQLDSLISNKNPRSADSSTRMNSSEESLDIINGRGYEIYSCEGTSLDENTPTSVGSLNRTFNSENPKECKPMHFLSFLCR
ncbi:UNVERIFIED_CONTAM: Kinesin-like protein KIN-7E, chloroplastic [Sesamum radiatum]|uniref:Kinesin-like protein KIN-7E, chloroplastic n=1 Tax=Sesamum radiatum TaxID=300843 RepID=A0AAW2SH15_SESRA